MNFNISQFGSNQTLNLRKKERMISKRWTDCFCKNLLCKSLRLKVTEYASLLTLQNDDVRKTQYFQKKVQYHCEKSRKTCLGIFNRMGYFRESHPRLDKLQQSSLPTSHCPGT
jgi:hypothetical protein